MNDYRTMFVSPRLLQLFLGVLRARRLILGAFALLTIAGIYGALHIPTDSSIDRLIVASDPVAQATSEFERVFPEGEQALIVLEAADPLSPDVLQGVDQLERQLNQIPKVAAHSLLTLYFRSTPPASINGCGLLNTCFFISDPSLLSELARVTIRPPETEIISAGITVTRPSPIVRIVYVASARFRSIPC